MITWYFLNYCFSETWGGEGKLTNMWKEMEPTAPKEYLE